METFENSVKVGKWMVVRATMKETMRATSMQDAFNIELNRRAKDAGIEDFTKLIKSISDNPELYETLTEAEMDFIDTQKSLAIWSTIGACVKPFITMSEWLGLSPSVVSELTNAMSDLNSNWFENPDQEKKTDERIMTSPNGSPTLLAEKAQPYPQSSN